MTINRVIASLAFRIEAAELARTKAMQALNNAGGGTIHKDNGDEAHFAHANYATSFTKGLNHDPDLGVVAKAEDFEAFRSAIDGGFIADFNAIDVPSIPADQAAPGKADDTRREWEAPTAGFVHDLEGPDAQAVTMAPAPSMQHGAPSFDELAYEMAEVYELALLRDVPFAAFADGAGNAKVDGSVARLNDLAYTPDGQSGRPRKGHNGTISVQTAFRGSSPGVEVGPYLSQFMLMGNGANVAEVCNGRIAFGAQRVNQRVTKAVEQDYMIRWEDWLAVQNGANTRHNPELFEDDGNKERFIATPRDLATYVHDDALYQAYLNACLLLLGMGAPTDPNFDKLSGAAPGSTVAGFALYGGPHILSLMTEIATRGLKAVRYQKFNIHLRLRPEALAARIACAKALDHKFPKYHGVFGKFHDAVGDVVGKICTHNVDMKGQDLPLLPMAFQEGSPMHPTYGAGHATVAGACVTMLKAFFDTSAKLVVEADGAVKFKTTLEPGDKPIAFVPKADGSGLDVIHPAEPLTLEGELNKLAANISIGRNMAGVHYFSDYYDSLRMGEEIAKGVIEEQALGYPKDPFVVSFRNFDGTETHLIGGDGTSSKVMGADGKDPDAPLAHAAE